MQLEEVLANTETPWGEIGYITYKRTYARRLKEDDVNSETEEFPQTVRRIIDASRSQLKVGFTPEEEAELAHYLLTLKGSVAGRFWWQLGTKTVKNLGLFSLQNCAFCVVDEPIRPFVWAMDALMLGSGVGYNIQKENVYQLPKLKGRIKIERRDSADADYIVPDTREGWVKLLGKVLKAHFFAGEGFSYSTQLIRGKGAPIKGFGGTASGPEVLCWGINEIHKILNAKANKKLRPIDCLDIMNIIGAVVVAGNVRRSAQIALGDPDDLEFLKAKRWDLGPIPNWRNSSNNTVVCSNYEDLSPEFWQTYDQGEPYGIANMELAKACGRLGDFRYKDNCEGFNPCAEQGLADKETCCLAEVFLPNITSYEELNKVIKYLYRICKHSLALPCHHPETQEIVQKNMRMGIGMTGVLQATDEQRGWLADAYEEIRAYDVEYSAAHGWPVSIKLTTSKPSGTLSLLAGVTPGDNPSPAGPYYIRRIRISADSPLVNVCLNAGYHVEYQRNFDGTEDYSTFVVSFPCSVPEGTPVAGNLKAVDHLESIKWLQTNWSDNSVSCTVNYAKEELEEIKEYLKKNLKDGIKTVSFLLYHGHGFDQAPYETIEKEDYDKLKKKVRPLNALSIKESDITSGLDECAGGACPIK